MGAREGVREGGREKGREGVRKGGRKGKFCREEKMGLNILSLLVQPAHHPSAGGPRGCARRRLGGCPGARLLLAPEEDKFFTRVKNVLKDTPIFVGLVTRRSA